MAVIDSSASPHIFDLILTCAPPESLLVLRATSKELRDRIDVARLGHIVVKDIDDDTSVFETQIEGPSVRAQLQLAPLSWRFGRYQTDMATPWIKTMQKRIRIIDAFLSPYPKPRWFRFPFCEIEHTIAPCNSVDVLISLLGGPATKELAFDTVRRARLQRIDIPAATYIDFILLHAKFDWSSLTPFGSLYAPPYETQKWVISVHYGLEKDDLPLFQTILAVDVAATGRLTHLTCIFTNTTPGLATPSGRLGPGVNENSPLGLLGDYVALLKSLPRVVRQQRGGWAPIQVTLVGAEDIPARLLHLDVEPTREELLEAITAHFSPLRAMHPLNLLSHDEYRTQVGPEQYELETVCPSSIPPPRVYSTDGQLYDDVGGF